MILQLEYVLVKSQILLEQNVKNVPKAMIISQNVTNVHLGTMVIQTAKVKQFICLINWRIQNRNCQWGQITYIFIYILNFLTACDCDAKGSKSQKCDDKGKCIDCNRFNTGNKCELCVNGHTNFPECDKCDNEYYGFPNCQSK